MTLLCDGAVQYSRGRLRSPKKVGGFTLLELLVAFSIMALMLGMFYRALGSSARGASQTQHYQAAVVLAQSLLELRDSIPASGWNESGSSAGYQWSVQSSPYATGMQGPRIPPLHEILITVQWGEDLRNPRVLALKTLRPERLPPQEVRR